MSDYIEYKDSIAFHPGYYIEELIEESGVTQEDFAKRLSTTPKNLSLLIRGKQSLSVEMATKLSRMLGTSAMYWLNLQNAFDIACAEIDSAETLEAEKDVLKLLGYAYFRENFELPDLPRMLDEQVVEVRRFLGVSSLTTLYERDLAVSFRGSLANGEDAVVARANAMVQIAVNKAIEMDAPKYDERAFKEAAEFALTQTKNHGGFYQLLQERFLEAGVVFVVLPNLSGSKVNGATKKVGQSVMLMVNDRNLRADTFWFTLFHEIGHILNKDFGISFSQETGQKEEAANQYAQNALIDPVLYKDFVISVISKGGGFSAKSITAFANKIDRDPGIVLGRLQNDKFVKYGDPKLEPLRHKYKVVACG